MKTRIMKYLIGLAAFLIIVACGKEPDEPAPLTGVTIPYRATVSEGMGTRAGLNGSQEYIFSEGDQLYVFAKVGETVAMYGLLDLKSGSGQKTATFEGKLTCVDAFIPMEDTPLSAVLVSESSLSSGFYSFSASGLLQGPAYPTTAFATSFSDAISKYGVFTAASSYGNPNFVLAQKSAFLIFSIELDPGTTSEVVSATIDSQTGDSRTANVPVTTRNSKKIASFVSAYPDATTFTNGTITVNGEEYEKKITASLEANKYYYVTRVKTAFDGFFIKATTDDTVVTLNNYFQSNKNNDGSLVQYSLNEGLDWTDFTNSTPSITLDEGETICLRAYRTNFSGYKNTNEEAGYYLFSTKDNKLCYIGGDIMSLLCTDLTLSEYKTTAPPNAFNSLFKFATWIDIDPTKPLRLTAQEFETTGEKKNYYKSMFHGCSSLTRAPVMYPVTNLKQGCYHFMFKKCVNLEEAPELPATTLAQDCYREMFYGCTSLTTAPELPATALTNYCYNQMFYGCIELKYIKCLATNILASDCTKNWVSGVSQTGTFVKNPEMSSWTTGANGIPTGWAVE